MKHILASGLLLIPFAAAPALVLGDKSASKPKVEPRADDILKKACTCAADLKEFGLKVEETFDEMSASGKRSSSPIIAK